MLEQVCWYFEKLGLYIVVVTFYLCNTLFFLLEANYQLAFFAIPHVKRATAL